MNKLPEYFGSDGKNNYGCVHIFLAPAYNDINKPTEEEKTSKPSFGGYDLLPYDPSNPQNIKIDYIVKYSLYTLRKADPIESNYKNLVLNIEGYAQYEDIITLYIFSPWVNEKNALNQAWTFMKNIYKLNERESSPYIEHRARLESLVTLSSGY